MNRKTFVYGTGNQAKLESMQKILAHLNIEIVGIKEIGVKLPEVLEDRNTPIENARIKALSYYKVLKRPVFSCDSGLYIEGLKDGEQPGIHVRTVKGKRLSDDEMTDYYANIAKNLGGRAKARYKNAICLVVNENEIYERFDDDISGEAFYLVEKPYPKRVEGFPLDCISVNIGNGEYYYGNPAESGISVMGEGFRKFFTKVLENMKG